MGKIKGGEEGPEFVSDRPEYKFERRCKSCIIVIVLNPYSDNVNIVNVPIHLFKYLHIFVIIQHT